MTWKTQQSSTRGIVSKLRLPQHRRDNQTIPSAPRGRLPYHLSYHLTDDLTNDLPYHLTDHLANHLANDLANDLAHHLMRHFSI
jgi:hypothetical protein